MADDVAANPGGPAPASERVRVRRLPRRGVYDQEAVHAILDEGLVCHVGFVADGQPFVIPTTYARVGDRLYIHGSAASRMLRTLREGVPVSVTVTLLDGLVLARSAFHHSMNYRSVVALGVAREVGDPAEKSAALDAIVEHVMPGRMADVRPPTPNELKATLVLCLTLEEVAAKVRSGPPLDDEEDYALPCWAGVLPLRLTPSAPVADPRLAPGIEPPAAVREYRRTG
jgi:nitroimidazol reductase NimA-like FMN-containing flavoprotein (pyridoxamine 5'-phosphate oxidase superfamily)